MFLSPECRKGVPFLPSLNGSPDLASAPRPERAVFRLRKWIILRLVSIVDSLHLEKEEALIEEVARWEMCPNPNSPWMEQPGNWASCFVLAWVPLKPKALGPVCPWGAG